jgi:hypothetical protein
VCIHTRVCSKRITALNTRALQHGKRTGKSVLVHVRGPNSPIERFDVEFGMPEERDWRLTKTEFQVRLFCSPDTRSQVRLRPRASIAISGNVSVSKFRDVHADAIAVPSDSNSFINIASISSNIVLTCRIPKFERLTALEVRDWHRRRPSSLRSVHADQR